MIYFIQDANGGPIKIGFSANPQQRMSDLQVGHPGTLRLLGVMDGSVIQEHRLHKQFNQIQGEWFEPTTNLLTFIDMHAIIPDKARSLLKRLPAPIPHEDIAKAEHEAIVTAIHDDKDLVWSIALLSIQERDGSYRFSERSLGELFSKSISAKRRDLAASVVRDLCLSFREMPADEVLEHLKQYRPTFYDDFLSVLRRLSLRQPIAPEQQTTADAIHAR